MIKKIAIAILFLFLPSAAYAEYQAEIMSLEGQVSVIDPAGVSAPAKEGDVLKAQSTVETGPASYADLAFDRDWKNVVRVEENSQMKIRSLYPTDLSLPRGGVFAKLKSLPPDSTFEVQTPTAIASVRGTEYRTLYNGGTGTEVFSFSDSPVYVFSLDAEGKLEGSPTLLASEEKTTVRRGEKPARPFRMLDGERKIGLGYRGSIEEKANVLRKTGRIGKVQNLDVIRRELKDRRRDQPEPSQQNFGPRESERKQFIERAEGSQKERTKLQEERRDEHRRKGKRKKPRQRNEGEVNAQAPPGP